ncbi:MAG: hypothetical protein IKO36_09525 [Bacteroidaceae bacterium]|nr:hypothetical protein [Bacteroidaceae bacterium]
MMKCNIKKTTHIVAFATLIGMLLGCSHKKVEIGEVYSDVDLINEFGNPTTVDTIVLKKGVSLYEFQGGLDKYIPQKDSLCIIQYIFNSGTTTTAIWAIGTEKNKRIIDFLKWDKKERNY